MKVKVFKFCLALFVFFSGCSIHRKQKILFAFSLVSGGLNVNTGTSSNTGAVSITYTGSPYTYTVNTPISVNTPSVTGTVTSSCSAEPQLPAGLSIDASCTISGTPSAVQSSTVYTITAVSSSGNAAASISIAVTVSGSAPTVSYSSSSYVFKQNAGITALTPAVTGTITSCSASPSLPAGLSISSTTCEITGTPTVNQGSSSYTVTASGPGGTAASVFSIIVQTAVYRIFVTASAYNGDLKTAGAGGDGPAGADNLCNADANKPNASSYKAVLFANGIRTSTVNWVLFANSSYVRGSDSAFLGTTDAGKVFAFPGTPLANSSAVGSQKQYWTGFRDAPNYWALGLYRCNEWTTSSAASEGRYGLSDALDYTSISEGTTITCNNVKQLLCAEQ